MKSNPFVEYVMYDVFKESDNVTVRPMMGGYILYKKGKVFALIDGEELYLKGNKEIEKWFLEHGSKKFSYKKKAKDGKMKIQTMNYFQVPEDVLEDKDSFKEWLLVQE